MRKAKPVARNVQLVSTATRTPPHILAMSVQKVTTALQGHPDLTTNPVNQARTIPKSKEIPLLTVCLVMQVTIVLILEMKNLPTHAVLDFIVLVEIENLSRAQHVAHPATSVLKARTT